MKYNIIGLILVLGLLGGLYTYQLGLNPFGFFCDEALYGLRSYQIWNGDIKSLVNPFIYTHFGYLQGTLFVYAPFLFVNIIGLSEFSVRLTSVVFSLLTMVVIWKTLILEKIHYPWVPILIFGLTPIIVHISRIYFGMTPSMFFMAFGYYLYVLSRKNNRHNLAVVAGLTMGVAIYGYSAFQVSILLLFISILLTELLHNKLQFVKYQIVAYLFIGLVLAYLPLGYTAINEPIFLKRLYDKNTSFTQLDSNRLGQLIRNYPKYFSPVYLFFKGELGMPGSFITRHSVNNAGLLSKSSIGLIILCFIQLFFTRDNRSKFFLPFFIMIFLYPLPDLITTKDNIPPYTFPASGSLILLPFVFAYGWELWVSLAEKLARNWRVSKYILLYVVSGICLFEAGMFFSHQYQEYPLVSSDYWGWQAGPREMVLYFIDHRDVYDQFYMEGAFNEPQVFLDFYLLGNGLRSRAGIANPREINQKQNILFGITPDSFSKLQDKDRYKVVKKIYYPNGATSWLLITLV